MTERPLALQGSPSGSDINARRLLNGLRRFWIYLPIGLGVCGVLTLAIILVQPYVYIASTSLVIQRQDPLGDLAGLAAQIPGGLLPNTGSGPDLPTEMLVVRSNQVLEGAIDQLHLQIGVRDLARVDTLGGQLVEKVPVILGLAPKAVPEDLQLRGLPIAFSASTVPAALDEVEWVLTHTSDTTYTLRDKKTNAAIGTGTLREPFQLEATSFTIDAIAGDIGDEYELFFKTRERALKDLGEHLGVRRPNDRANLLVISVEDESPVTAKAITNAIASAYLSQTKLWKDGLAKELDGYLDGEIQRTELELDAAQAALNQYRAESGTVAISEETKGLISLLTDAKLGLATQEIETSQLQFAYNRLQHASTEDFLVFLSGRSAEVPVQASMVQELSQLVSQRDGFLTSRTAQHPEVQSLDAQIATKRGQILDLVSNALASARQRQGLIAGQVNALDAERSNIPETETTLSGLAADAQLTAQLLTALKTRKQQNEIGRAASVSPIRQLDPAYAPTEKARPQPAVTLLLSLLVGFALGASAAIIRELLDTAIRRRDQAEALGVPVIAQIPNLGEHLKTPLPSGQRLFLAIRQDGNGPIAESFRMLRGAVTVATSHAVGRVLGITSPGVSEGKTFVTLNLAAVFAQAGYRTLLIDTDLRRPAVARNFGLPPVPGLSDVLEGRAPIQEAVRESGIAGLSIITAGQKTANPSELLTSDAFPALLQSLRREPDASSAAARGLHFDVILLDLPPVEAVSETIALAKLTTALYLLLRAGRTPEEIAADALRRLETAKVAVRGIILNDVSKVDLGPNAARYLYYDYREEHGERGLWDRLSGARRRRQHAAVASERPSDTEAD